MTNFQFERVPKLVIDAIIHPFHPHVLETCRKGDDALELHVLRFHGVDGVGACYEHV